MLYVTNYLSKSNLSHFAITLFSIETNIRQMRISGNASNEIVELSLKSFSQRLAQAIARSGLNQSEFARKIAVSPGFVSDMVRGNKKPGAEFLSAVRLEFGVSADWLLTGKGTISGRGYIDLDLLRSIRLYVALARGAIIQQNTTAVTVARLIRDGRIREVLQDSDIAAFVQSIATTVEDSDLALELYNGHLETQDPIEQQRNLLTAAMAHFESRKPFNSLAVLSRAFGDGV